MTVKQIEKALLKLDRRSRAKLAEKLLQSLDDLSDVENARLWTQEALRRHRGKEGHGRSYEIEDETSPRDCKVGPNEIRESC